ncbi:hypothetical protein ACVA51_25000 (plasmid) [Pseudomonas luteola]
MNFNFLFRLLLTINATSLLLVVFLVQKSYTLDYFFPSLKWLAAVKPFGSYLFYIVVPATLTLLSIRLSSWLGKDEFSAGDVVEISHANNSFLPSYLGYFFVALSVPNWDTLIVVYGMLFVFTFRSQALYFNPLFLLYGFEFYNVTTRGGASLFLISKKRYKLPATVVIHKARRINDFTFMEGDK